MCTQKVHRSMLALHGLSMVPVAGTVTRTSEVRPELFMGCFRCLECGTLVRDVEQQFKFTEPLMCTQTACQNKCGQFHRVTCLCPHYLQGFLPAWRQAPAAICEDGPAGNNRLTPLH